MRIKDLKTAVRILLHYIHLMRNRHLHSYMQSCLDD